MNYGDKTTVLTPGEGNAEKGDESQSPVYHADNSVNDSASPVMVPMWRRWWSGTWPMLALVGITLWVWGHTVLAHFASLRLSNPGDAESFALYLSWNAHALTHLEDPFFLPNLYAPGGMDLGNAISLPGVSLLVAPVSLIFGGTAGYNAAVLLAIFFGAAAVYLLARELTGSKIGAMCAGVLMVVCPYFTGHGGLGHLNLMWVFGLPFIGYLLARYVKGTLGGWWLALWVALTVGFTIGASTELFVMEPIFAGLGIVVAVVFVDRAQRRRLIRSIPFLALGALGGILLGLPVIVAGLRTGIPDAPGNPPALYSTEVTNIIAPTRLVQFGESFFQYLWPSWVGNDAENTAYIPISLLLFVLAYAFASRSRLAAGTAVFALLALIASFGPFLTIAGKSTVPMPWSYLMEIKGLDHALPARFSAYVFMAVVIMVADGWARRVLPRPVTAVVVGLSFVLLIPNFQFMGFPTQTASPEYVASGRFAAEIEPDENVLVLPAGEWGPGLRWVDELDFSFRMPTGNGGGASPPSALKDPVAWALFAQDLKYPYRQELPPYLQRVGVDLIIVDEAHPEWKAAMDDALPVAAVEEGGVWVYRLA
jgi:hypothetical protein